jgi:hypothetical protein
MTFGGLSTRSGSVVFMLDVLTLAEVVLVVGSVCCRLRVVARSRKSEAPRLQCPNPKEAAKPRATNESVCKQALWMRL